MPPCTGRAPAGLRCRAFNPGKLERVDALLAQWAGNEAALEAACRRNYGVERALSRDFYAPPAHSLANLLAPAVLQVAPGDVLGAAPAGTLCLDLRGDAARGSGALPAALAVEGRLWGSELMLEGVLRCLQEIRGKVRAWGAFQRRKPWF